MILDFWNWKKIIGHVKRITLTILIRLNETCLKYIRHVESHIDR